MLDGQGRLYEQQNRLVVYGRPVYVLSRFLDFGDASVRPACEPYGLVRNASAQDALRMAARNDKLVGSGNSCRRSTSLVLGGILPSKVKLAIAACYIRALRGEDANGSKYWRKAFLPFSRLPIQRGTGSRACGSVGALVPVSASIPILAILAALLSGRGAPQ